MTNTSVIVTEELASLMNYHERLTDKIEKSEQETYLCWGNPEAALFCKESYEENLARRRRVATKIFYVSGCRPAQIEESRQKQYPHLSWAALLRLLKANNS